MILKLNQIKETPLGNSLISIRALQKKKKRLREVRALDKKQAINDLADI